MAPLANAVLSGQASRKACQASRPPRPLGHPSRRHLLLPSGAGPFLGTVAVAGRSLYSFFRPRQSPFLDWRTRPRPPVANRCRSQRRSRAHHFGTLSLRSPSHLHVHARCSTRHRLAHHALVVAPAFAFTFHQRHVESLTPVRPSPAFPVRLPPW